MAKKRQNDRSRFGFGRRSSRSRGGAAKSKTALQVVLKAAIVLAVTGGIVGTIVGFAMLDRFVRRTSGFSYRLAQLELINPPAWIGSSGLTELITRAAGGTEFPITDTVARSINERLSVLPWLYNVQVQATEKTLKIHAGYRQPMAVVECNRKKYYLCQPKKDDPVYNETYKSIVVLDYVPIDNLKVIRINGFAARTLPQSGMVLHDGDLVSTVQLLAKLAEIDRKRTPKAPLLNHIESVDVSNYQGRKDAAKPHVILYAKDGTPIFWGAAFGQAHRYLEARESEKIDQLYSYYKKHGTIQCITAGLGPNIDLQPPRYSFPRPTE